MNNHHSFQLIENLKKTMTHDIGNSGPGFARHRNVAALNRLMRSQPSPLNNWISNRNNKSAQIRFHSKDYILYQK